jgi:hypothetical protein
VALQLDYIDSQTGITVPDAYWRISSICGGKNGFSFIVDIWKDQAARDMENDSIPMKFLKQLSYAFIPQLDSVGFFAETELDSAGYAITVVPNFVEQAYDYIKTLDEFSGAIDI